MSGDDIRELVRSVLAADAELAAHRDRRAAEPVDADETLRALSRHSAEARRRLERRLEDLRDALATGDQSASGDALDYLEADPFYFRSGYARCKIAGRLARLTLSGDDLGRARGLVLAVVDGAAHCCIEGAGRLARSVADNPMRRALRDRLHSPDAEVAGRALRVIVQVRHPGLSPADLRAARSVVLADAARYPYLSPSVARLARWLWDPPWSDELRTLTRHHGPERAAAKRLLEAADQRRRRRPSP